MASRKASAKAPQVTIDKCFAGRVDPKTGAPLGDRWRVYYWAERPDSDKHTAEDQYHWAIDSEHDNVSAANARAAELKKGAKPKAWPGMRLAKGQ